MKKPLEHSLKFILFYLFILVAGSFLCGSFFMVYTLCKTLVAGEGIKVVDGFLFIYGVLYFTPLVLMTSGLFSILYFIRHPDFSIASKIVFFVLYASVWLFLMPLSMDLDVIVLENQSVEKQETVSTGYFRKQGNQTVYYSKKYYDADGELAADGCVIRNNRMEYFKGIRLIGSSEGFADPIMKSSIQMNPTMSFLLRSYTHFLEVIGETRLRGFVSWICVASMFLAFLGIMFVSRFSYWRLLDVIVSFILFFGVITLNSMSFFFPPFKAASEFFARLLFFIDGNAFVLVMNVTLFLLFSAAGLIISRIRRRSAV
ncbi:MAG: hypothetical protein J6Z17_06470 [Treponema sp.]|nr:hypothetical protein [Treponema sp.]